MIAKPFPDTISIHFIHQLSLSVFSFFYHFQSSDLVIFSFFLLLFLSLVFISSFFCSTSNNNNFLFFLFFLFFLYFLYFLFLLFIRYPLIILKIALWMDMWWIVHAMTMAGLLCDQGSNLNKCKNLFFVLDIAPQNFGKHNRWKRAFTIPLFLTFFNSFLLSFRFVARIGYHDRKGWLYECRWI